MWYAMREALAIVSEEGLDAMWARHEAVHKQLWEGLRSMGLEPFVEDPKDRLVTVNTIKVGERTPCGAGLPGGALGRQRALVLLCSACFALLAVATARAWPRPVPQWQPGSELRQAIGESGIYVRASSLIQAVPGRQAGVRRGAALLSNCSRPCCPCARTQVPEGVDWAAVCKNAMDKYNVEIAGGLGPTAGKIWRVGLMGERARTPPSPAVAAAVPAALVPGQPGRLVSAVRNRAHRRLLGLLRPAVVLPPSSFCRLVARAVLTAPAGRPRPSPPRRLQRQARQRGAGAGGPARRPGAAGLPHQLGQPDTRLTPACRAMQPAPRPRWGQGPPPCFLPASTLRPCPPP